MAVTMKARTKRKTEHRMVAHTRTVVVGVDIHLSPDDATHLLFFMRTAVDGQYLPQMDDGVLQKAVRTKYIDKWPWAKRFVEELERVRGVGCTMGARADPDAPAVEADQP